MMGSVMIGFEMGDNRSFITVSSFGKSLLKQLNLFEEAFILLRQRVSSFSLTLSITTIVLIKFFLKYNIFIKSTRQISSKRYNLK